MKKPNLQNAIRVNHRGFMPKSHKSFVLTENKTQDTTFSVFIVDNVVEKKVYTGTLTEACEGDNVTILSPQADTVADSLSSMERHMISAKDKCLNTLHIKGAVILLVGMESAI